MNRHVLAIDLSTGGVKASLCREDGVIVKAYFNEYKTFYNGPDRHEQRPQDWYDGTIEAIKHVVSESGIDASQVVAISISGHSLCAVPIDKSGRLLTEFTPIWSDKRAFAEADEFFRTIPYEDWYETTGNGFPPECYSLFKIMWLRNHDPELFQQAYKFLGSKDYVNFRLTDVLATDHSYASGSGAYNLEKQDYEPLYLQVAGVDENLLPNLLESRAIVGTLTSEASNTLGLNKNTKVMAGGVDNAVMALGANGYEENSTYLSLGSSSWIAINTKKPLLDQEKKPYVFAHCISGMYTSATSIFAAGSSLRWLRDQVFPDKSYKELDQMAASAPAGSNNLLFNPSLAGGAMIEESPDIAGGFIGLKLRHTGDDLVRAVMEGVSFNLRYALDVLTSKGVDVQQLLVVGGGAKSDFWIQLLATILGKAFQTTGQGLETTTVGAAALAFVGNNIWQDYTPISRINRVEQTFDPNAREKKRYDELYEISRDIAHWLSITGEALNKLSE